MAAGGIAAAALALAGCATGDLPALRYYTLAPPAGGAAATSPTEEGGLRIGVEPVAVDPPYDQDRLVYRIGRDSTEVGFYHYHRWASPLGTLATHALAEGLREAPGVAAAEPAADGGSYSARLSGRLLRLEEVDTAGGQTVHVALRATLTDDRGAVLWSGTLAASRSLDTDRVGEIAAAMAQAFADVVAQARTEIPAAFR